MTNLVVTKSRAQDVWAVDDVKRYMRIDFNDDDVLIQTLIKAAQNHVEQYLGRTLLKQSYKLTWQYTRDGKNQALEYFVASLPMGPVISVDKVFDCDRQEDLKRVSFDLESSRPTIMFARCHENVDIHYTCGYGETPDAVPAELRQAILVIIADMYRNRDALNPSQLKEKVENLLQCYLPKRLG